MIRTVIFRSYASFCAETFRHYAHYPMSIHPFSKIRLALEIAFVLFIIFTYTILPLHYSENHVSLVSTSYILSISLEGINIADITRFYFNHRLSIIRPTKRGKQKSPSNGQCLCQKEVDDYLLAC
jgi:hypothetical protein